MRVTANIRIQWLHEEILRGTYPNAARLSEQFHISRRQAQRDIEFLKRRLGAPLAYDSHIMGYRYSRPFTLPVSVKNQNDGGLSRLPVHDRETDPAAQSRLTADAGVDEADAVIIQGQIPFTATLGITDKLTVMEMRSYIVSQSARGRFLCEFHNIDRFLCAVLTARSGIRIIEPAWLRERLLQMADKVTRANAPADDCEITDGEE